MEFEFSISFKINIPSTFSSRFHAIFLKPTKKMCPLVQAIIQTPNKIYSFNQGFTTQINHHCYLRDARRGNQPLSSSIPHHKFPMSHCLRTLLVFILSVTSNTRQETVSFEARLQGKLLLIFCFISPTSHLGPFSHRRVFSILTY